MAAPRVKRVYEAAGEDDGLRVLVDRLWPRGLTKAQARVDVWLKDIAPSTELRKRFHAAPGDWDRFRKDYAAEIKDSPALAELRELARAQPVTLLYGSRDTEHNHAVLLAKRLRRTRQGTGAASTRQMPP